MSIKLKALGLGLVVALALGAMSSMSATAETGGHFTSDVPWIHIKASQEGSLHQNVFDSPGLENAVTCTTWTYTASVGGTPVTQIFIIFHATNCHTTEGGYPVTVDTNGCGYTLTIGKEPESKFQTTHLTCSGSNEIVMTVNPPIVGECWIHIPPQTPTTGGVKYTTIVASNKHALTLDIEASGITNNRTSVGFAGCAGGAGEDNNSALIGTATAEGFNTSNEQVNITATGP